MYGYNSKGASEASPFSMVVFFGAMAQNSDVQANAQQELDHHLGCRLPEFEDQPYLPYTVAIMLEILRYRPRHCRVRVNSI